MRFLLVDTETTEKDTSIARMISGAYLLLDTNFAVLASDHRYLWNGYSQISPGAQKVHHITTEFLAEHAQYPDAAMDAWFMHVQRANLIAHGAAFDAAILEGEMFRADHLIGFNNKFCTMSALRQAVQAKDVNGRTKAPKLIECCEFFGVTTDFIDMLMDKYFPDIIVPNNMRYHCAAFDVCALYACLMKGGLFHFRRHYDLT